MAWRFKRAADTAPATKQPATKSPAGKRDYTPVIIEAAKRHGVPPQDALAVAHGEGGVKGWIRARGKRNGKQEPAYGPFQMLVGGGDTGYPTGLGNKFMEETGLDPRDEANAEAVIDYAVKTGANEGWGQWYGAPARLRKASTGRAHGAGGASLGVGVGGSNIEGGAVAPEAPDFAAMDLGAEDPGATLTGSEGIPEVDPLDEEEKTLADVLGQGFELNFEGTDEIANAGLQRSAELKDDILAMIANGIESQTSRAVLPGLPSFAQNS